MFEFKLPDVGEGVAEGEIVEWHVEAGDEVEEDQVLAEVETDKAVVDVPSPVAGTVVERHAEAGEVLPVGETLVTIDTGEEGEAPAEPEASAAATEEPAAASETEAPAPPESPSAGGADRVFAPPHVRRLAREMGVDVATVAGSGPGGRVTGRDVRETAGGGGAGDDEVASAITEVDEGGSVEGDDAGDRGGSAAEGSGTKPAIRRVDDAERGGEAVDDEPVPGAGPSQPTRAAPRDRTLAAPATRKLARDLDVDLDAVPTDETHEGEAFVTATQVRRFAEDGAAEPATEAGDATADAAEGRAIREPYRGVRRTIGRQMEKSAFTAPHVTHHDSVEVSELVDARAAMRDRTADTGVTFTYMPLVLKAVVAGLRAHPRHNSELDEEREEIHMKREYNVGVATATDAGLMVPVVRDVDEKGLVELAREVADLTSRARDRSISREEMQGGTFTVTNFGAIGGEYATPIINYPETAILGLGSIEERPWVEDGEVVARPVLPLSLSIDHRVVDGAEAARFVNTVKEYLRTPSLLLLEE